MRVKTAFNALEIGHNSPLDSQFIKIFANSYPLSTVRNIPKFKDRANWSRATF